MPCFSPRCLISSTYLPPPRFVCTYEEGNSLKSLTWHDIHRTLKPTRKDTSTSTSHPHGSSFFSGGTATHRRALHTVGNMTAALQPNNHRLYVSLLTHQDGKTLAPLPVLGYPPSSPSCSPSDRSSTSVKCRSYSGGCSRSRGG